MKGYLITIFSKTDAPGKVKRDYVRRESPGGVEWGRFVTTSVPGLFAANCYVKPGDVFDARGSGVAGQSWCKFKVDEFGVHTESRDNQGNAVPVPPWLTVTRCDDIPATFADPRAPNTYPRGGGGRRGKGKARTSTAPPAQQPGTPATINVSTMVGVVAWPQPIGEVVDTVAKSEGLIWGESEQLAILMEFIEERHACPEFACWLEAKARAESAALKSYGSL